MRIAIVNDMLLAVEAMRRAVLSSGEHSIAWVARDGEEAVTLCANNRPDLILMDLIMPRLDGVLATRRIMEQSPCPILVVTANMNEQTGKVFEAMGAGALDAVTTPVLGRPGDMDGTRGLLSKIDSIRRLVGTSTPPTPVTTVPPSRAPERKPDQLVAIGASAGGPAALAKVLSGLPADFPAGVVAVQHVDVQFAKGLADWLGMHTALKVQLAAEGDEPAAGQVYLSGRDQHLVFTSFRKLGYMRPGTDCSFCPSVDIFFESANRFWNGRLAAVLLTGMGRDGARGLKLLREAGHATIAQDAETSAVYGMPKAAADLGAAGEILALDKIGPRLRMMFAS